ncbi:hypothetical protein VTK56DRAFT_565 [Thermocarpiscus australiensis]
MLSPRFKEGQELREAREQNQRARLTLEEDHVKAMDFILRELHHQGKKSPDMIFSAEEIAKIAIQANKYDFSPALLPWINIWCRVSKFPVKEHDDGTKDVADMGFALLAASLWRSDKFYSMSEDYVTHLPANFAATWQKHQILQYLPQAIWEALEKKIKEEMSILRYHVLALADRLRYKFTVRKKRDYSGKYGDCSDRRDNIDLRMMLYIQVLSDVGIWPTLDVFETKSVTQVVGMLKQLPGKVRDIHGSRSCSRPRDCLVHQVEQLCEIGNRALNRMRGVYLTGI